MNNNFTLNNTYSNYDLILVPSLKARISELSEDFITSRDITDKRLIENDITYLQDELTTILNNPKCFSRLQTIYDS